MILGFAYILFLVYLSRKYQLNAIEKVNVLVFDISKLLLLSFNEKRIFKEKSDIFNSENLNNNSGTSIGRLNLRIKYLQSFLEYKNKFVLSLIEHKESRGLVITIILLFSPSLFFIHYLMPSNTSIINIGEINIDTEATSLKVFFYFFNNKLFNFILLSIWFFTTRNILKHGIFFNLILTVFQFVTILIDTNKIDENELLTALPIMIPILLTFLLLHKIIKYKSKNEILNGEIEQEIQEVLTAINTLEEHENNLVAELISLRENQSNLSKAAYQQELLRIKAAIERKIATD
ncbi:hypothetical protein H0I25_09770 [Cellulophaga sp. HaHa_2_95]|uniref:hypothetical protein n=1 Tax=Cellulophaga sp. HaHa_2_95 TaxID=2745558 RepID=UPI001C4FFFD5|nr:hypothetical protein [Cellulophaga sp. HaHa_2_95]QXP54380.1 hypothetical protein H0I25_09770 [Cellulophaga sp. HaHa_2_95]